MSSLTAPTWRRWSNQGGVWNLFAWFGRSTDQFAGLLLHPIVLVVFARSLNSDAARISWFIGVFGVCWAAGFALAPLLQQMTVRVMPWIVGGYVVRTAAVLLLAFAVSERTADTEQRFRSAIICYGAYAAATGIARSSQARHIVHGSAHGLWDNTSITTTLMTQLVLALGALTLWTALSEPELPWSQAFGRIWYLAAVAIGIATLAAIHQGSRNPEVPRTSERTNHGETHEDDRHRAIFIAVAVAVGASAVTFVEGLAFLTVFDDFRRQSIMVRASVGFLAAGWVVGSVIWGIARTRYTPPFLTQLALGLSMIGIVVSLSLNDLSRGEWFPETILGTNSIHFCVYAMAALIGGGLAGRRYMLNPVFERIDLNHWARVPLSVAAGLAPVGLAYAVRNLDVQIALGIGLGVCLLVVIALGTLDRSGIGRTLRAASDPALASRLATR